MTVAAAKLTEAEVLQMLRARYTEKAGNGDAWAFCTHVRNAAGFDAGRTVDAIAMSLWPSRGLELLGFEVKCSRSDWVRELQRPEKAEAFANLVDRWFLVVADEKIVQEGELPATWGLLAVRGKKLVCVKDAPRLRHATGMGRKSDAMPPRFDRSFLAALMRASNKSGALREELAEAREAAIADAKRSSEVTEKLLRDDAEALRLTIQEFEEGVGLPGYLLNRWRRDNDPKKLGQTVRMVLDGEDQAAQLEQRLQRIVEQAGSIAKHALDTIDGKSTGDLF